MNFENKALLSLGAAPVGFRYEPNTAAGKLERHMKERGVHSVGKYVDNGRLRCIDLTPEARAWRTLWIKDLSVIQRDEVHVWERKNFTNRLAFSWEAQEFLQIEKKEYVIKKNHMPALIEFNNRNRPLMDRSFQGYKIPAYFLDDMEFDGLEYNQSWDKCVFIATLPYLPDKTRQTVSGAITE